MTARANNSPAVAEPAENTATAAASCCRPARAAAGAGEGRPRSATMALRPWTIASELANTHQRKSEQSKHAQANMHRIAKTGGAAVQAAALGLLGCAHAHRTAPHRATPHRASAGSSATGPCRGRRGRVNAARNTRQPLRWARGQRPEPCGGKNGRCTKCLQHQHPPPPKAGPLPWQHGSLGRRPPQAGPNRRCRCHALAPSQLR